jgi:hypothetical protein
MLKYLLAFCLGAVTVIVLVIATSRAGSAGLVVLGFLTATICNGTVAFVVGPHLLAGSPKRNSGGSLNSRMACRTTPKVRSKVEDEVVSALLHQGVKHRAAVTATSRAALEAPQEFEALFRAALAVLSTSRTAATASLR